MVRRFAAWWRGWRYHWSPGTRPQVEPVRVGEGDPRFGSMSLEDELRAQGWTDEKWASLDYGPDLLGRPCRVITTGFLPAPDWREQTMAELSPEALEHPQGPQAAVPWGDDPGPGGGVSSLAPGPASALNVALPGPGVGDGIEWAVNAAIGPHIERLADTGDIRDAGLLAGITAYMRDQDADVADWLAGRAMTWARLEIGALT